MLVIFIVWPFSVLVCFKARRLCGRRVLDLQKIVVCLRTALDHRACGLFHFCKDVDGAYALSHGHDHYGRFCGLNHLKDGTTHTMHINDHQCTTLFFFLFTLSNSELLAHSTRDKSCRRAIRTRKKSMCSIRIYRMTSSRTQRQVS